MLGCFRLFFFAQFPLRMPEVVTAAAAASPTVGAIIHRAMEGTIRVASGPLIEAGAIGT